MFFQPATACLVSRICCRCGIISRTSLMVSWVLPCLVCLCLLLRPSLACCGRSSGRGPKFLFLVCFLLACFPLVVALCWGVSRLLWPSSGVFSWSNKSGNTQEESHRRRETHRKKALSPSFDQGVHHVHNHRDRPSQLLVIRESPETLGSPGCTCPNLLTEVSGKID